MSKYDVWHLLHKLSDTDAKELGISDVKDPYQPLPEGVVTDGFGNLYQIPTTGQTPLIQLEDDNYFKYRYNWETNEIEVYVKDDSIENGLDNYSLLESVGLSPYDFIDNPEYWYRNVAETIEEDTGIDLRDFETKEAYELYGEIIDEDKDMYEYEIRAEIEMDLDDWNDDLSEYEEQYKNYVENFSKDTELYGEHINITAEYDSYANEIKIIVKYPMVLTKEELLDIYDDVKDYFTNLSPDLPYHITNIGITDIVEM